MARRPLDLSWVSEKWWPLLTGRTTREPAPTEVDRRHFAICLFTQVVNELKSGDLCISGSEEYGDYRDQLVSWEEYSRDVAGYAEQAGMPADAAAFVAALKARLAATAAATDRGFPENEHVEIVDGEPVVKRLRARDATDNTAFLERLVKARLVPAGVLEALADTEHRLGWTRHFGPVSGFEAKLERPRERYLATVFCYGCALGPSQAARSLKGLDMLRVVLSIRAGRLLPSAILRRFTTYSRKNRLYFAFRELGRVIRTDFLLRYLGSIELRRAIQAATNKSKLFNRYAQWVAIGSYELDLSKPPAPLPFELPTHLFGPRQPSPAAPV